MKRRHHVLQQALQALWVGVLPALLAALALKVLVPSPGAGAPGLVATLGRQFPIPFAVGLFFVFSLMARYWRFRLPGGRYASALPAHVAPAERDGRRLAEWATAAGLYQTLTSQSMRRRVERTLDAPSRGDLEHRVTELGRALEAGDLANVRDAATSLGSVGASVLAAHRRRETWVTLGAIGAVAGLALGVRARVIESYRVVSASMVPTFEVDDHVLGRRVAFAAASRLPRRGDVVVFHSAAVEGGASRSEPRPEVLIKRVVGLPGDAITMHGEVPVINGWPVPTCTAGPYLYLSADGEGGSVRGIVVVEFLDDHAYLTVHSAPAPPFNETYVVPPGEVFVLGDNRGNSVDSRAYGQGHGGGVPLSGIVARADWFLLGTHRSGNADFSRMFEPIARVEHRLHLEGMTAGALEQGIATCLARRPADTRPPPPVVDARAGGSSDRGPT